MSVKSIAVVSSPPKTAGTTPVAARPSEEEIAVRAHQLYEQRGSEAGHEMEDWLQAERELRAARKS